MLKKVTIPLWIILAYGEGKRIVMNLKKCFSILTVLLLSMSLCNCVCLAGNEVKRMDKGTTAYRETVMEQDPLTKQINEICSSLSEEEKIAQMMFVGLSGTALNTDDLQYLQKEHFGGVVLFDRNMVDVAQVKLLNAEIQAKGSLVKIFGDKTVRLPIFIAVDSEGGLVLRMKDNWPYSFPSQEFIGKSGNPDYAKMWAKIAASTLAYMGFNVNFAPVADVDSTYERAYSKDFYTVTNFVSAAVDGYAEEGIICTLKHFPGIGRATMDPHFEGSVIKEDWSVLENTDLVPFKQAISTKDNDKMMIMISHLTYLALDKDNPSSLSKKIVTELLKDQVGFKGLVITDDLEMGAVSKHYSFEEMGVRAINAGVDLALVCHSHEHIMAVYKGLLSAYRMGKISRDRVDDAVKKIIRVKLSLLKQ